MEALLTPLVGSRVKLGQRNGQDVEGVLINARSDYATVFTDKGDMIHYPYTLIKSVTRNLKESPRLSSIPDIAFPDTFKEVLAFMVRQMVEIENSEGITRGVVIEVTPENVGIVSDMKFVYYPIDQIYSISPIYKIKSINGKKHPEPKDSHKANRPEKHLQRRSEQEDQKNGDRQEEDSSSAPYYALVDEDDAYEFDKDDAHELNGFAEPDDKHEPDEDDEPEVDDEDWLEADEEDLLEADVDDEPEEDEEDLLDSDEDDEVEMDEDASDEEQIEAAESMSLEVPFAKAQDDQPSSLHLEDEQSASTGKASQNQPENPINNDPIYESFFKNPAASAHVAGESSSVQSTQPTVVLPQSTGNSFEDPRDIYQKTLNSGLPELFMWRNPVEKEQDVNGNQASATESASERDSGRDSGRHSTNLSTEREKERRSTGGDSRRETTRRSTGRDSGRRSDRHSTGRGSGRATDRRSSDRNATHKAEPRSTGRGSGRGANGRSSGRGTGGSPKGRSR